MSKFLTPEVRTWIYGISVALIALLVALGVIADGLDDKVLNLVAALLGLGNAGMATAYRPTRKVDPEAYLGPDF